MRYHKEFGPDRLWRLLDTEKQAKVTFVCTALKHLLFLHKDGKVRSKVLYLLIYLLTQTSDVGVRGTT